MLIPKLEILPRAQRRLWDELRQTPEEFVLYGGTALGLRLGHRQSEDFDFFSNVSFAPDSLSKRVLYVQGAEVSQSEANTLTVIVQRDGPVKVSFFGVPNLRRLSSPVIAGDNGLPVASLLDLAGTKASVVQMRAEAKDYIDLDALITAGKVDLSTALSAAQQIYGQTFNPQITLKALSYFDDGDLRALPEEMKTRLVVAARAVDLEHLPGVERTALSRDLDQGHEL